MSGLTLKSESACRFDCVSVGEVMLRLDPGEGRIRTARSFRVWEGGGEYNVARGMRKVFGLRAGVVTAPPRQRFGSWLEAAVVPLVAQLPVLALLPLALVPRVRAASLSMANGQWLAFTRDAYRASGGHAVVPAGGRTVLMRD